MKAVLMSIKPKWWEKILSGEKLFEIRKTAPSQKSNEGDGKKFDWPLTVFAYVSGTGMVKGQFTCAGRLFVPHPTEHIAKYSCVPMEDLLAYQKGGTLWAWLVKAPKEYEAPRPLAEFGLNRPPVSWQYVEVPDVAEV